MSTAKIPLVQLIREVEREIERRRSEYPRLIDQGKMRASEAAFAISRMEAVLNTLCWLSRHETQIKSGLKVMKAREERECSINT